MSSFLNELFSFSSITDASNVHQNFLDFEKAISIAPAKKKKAVLSMFAIQEKLVYYFNSIKHLPYYNFDQQGSYKMGTMALGKNGIYDIDFGIHSIEKPSITPQTLKQHIYKALEGHTQYGTINKDKCVRVLYAGDFDIDVTAYYKTKEDTHPYLATTNGWLISNPPDLIKWYKAQPNNFGQLTRVVKYLKYWANTKQHKMPSGIALTILAAKNFKPNERDDIAFYETVKAIKDSFFWSVECTNPSAPNDNLIAKLNDQQRRKFITYLETLVADAKNAVLQKSKENAVIIWKQIFGNKFN
jgi:hypothetical protein